MSHIMTNDTAVDVNVDLGISVVPTPKNMFSLTPFRNRSGEHNFRTFSYLISEVDGLVPFYINDDFPDCNTMNIRHQHYDVDYQTKLHMERCRTTRKSYLQSKLGKCTHAQLHKKHVQGRRLSTIIKQKGIKKIRNLIIDARGSDFAILKDLVHNAAVQIRKITLNCQRLNQSIPRWLASNDCDDIKSYMEHSFESSLHVVEEQTSCQSNEFKMIFSRLNHKVPDLNFIFKKDPPGIVDIDIGTLGSPISSNADKLITFDPFDKLLRQDKYERYPFVISDVDGKLPFFANDKVGGCSTLNFRNEHYDIEYQSKIHQRCGTSRKKFLSSFLVHCMHFPQRRMVVHSLRLSRFVRERNIRHIRNLKIDAQGSDFAILKDVIENAEQGLRIENITIECQWLNDSIPLYFTSNDCGHIEEYMKDKFEGFQLVKQLNNCNVNEYNFIYRGLQKKKKGLILDTHNLS